MPGRAVSAVTVALFARWSIRDVDACSPAADEGSVGAVNDVSVPPAVPGMTVDDELPPAPLTDVPPWAVGGGGSARVVDTDTAPAVASGLLCMILVGQALLSAATFLLSVTPYAALLVPPTGEGCLRMPPTASNDGGSEASTSIPSRVPDLALSGESRSIISPSVSVGILPKDYTNAPLRLRPRHAVVYLPPLGTPTNDTVLQCRRQPIPRSDRVEGRLVRAMSSPTLTSSPPPGSSFPSVARVLQICWVFGRFLTSVHRPA